MRTAILSLIFCLTFVILLAEEYEPRYEAVFQMYKAANALKTALHEPVPILQEIKYNRSTGIDVRNLVQGLLGFSVGRVWLGLVFDLPKKARTWDDLLTMLSKRGEEVKSLIDQAAHLPADSAAKVIKPYKDSLENLELLASLVNKSRGDPNQNVSEALLSIARGLATARAFPYSKPAQKIVSNDTMSS